MKIKAIVGGLAIVGAAIGGTLLYVNGNTHTDNVADSVVPLYQQAKENDPAAIERGRYIAIAGDCVACHTAPGSRDAFAGGYAIKTPFGGIYTSNITPDRETGIGDWTERDFYRAVRHGKGIKGENLYPAMPYNAYVQVSDQDMHDLWLYMRTVKPIHNAVPETQLPFPYNIRLAMMGWNLLFFSNKGFEADPTRSTQWNRGAYLVRGLEHCASCHTPKNALGGDSNKTLQGGNIGDWFAPDITNNEYTGIGRWTPEQIVQYLKEGSNHVAVASGPMAEAVTNSTQYLTDDDLQAIATYLSTHPGSATRSPQAVSGGEMMRQGEQVYAVNCTACHNSDGKGIPHLAASLADNPAIMAADPTSLLTTILEGGRGAVTHANPTSGAMPSFAWKLSDQQAAAVATYIRNSWGNAANPVTVKEVSTRREALKLPSQMPAQ